MAKLPRQRKANVSVSKRRKPIVGGQRLLLSGGGPEPAANYYGFIEWGRLAMGSGRSVGLHAKGIAANPLHAARNGCDSPREGGKRERN